MPNTQGTSENVLTSFTFSLEIDGVDRQTFTEVDGLSVTVQVVESWGSDASARITQQKVAGQVEYGELTVTTNLTTESFIRDWRKQVIEGKFTDYRRNGSIVLYNTELQEQARWNFENAWPSTWSLSDLTAGSSAVMTESVTLVHERLVRA